MSKLFISIFTITFVCLFCNCKDVKEENQWLELLRSLLAPAAHHAKQNNPKARAQLFTSLKADIHQVMSSVSYK